MSVFAEPVNEGDDFSEQIAGMVVKAIEVAGDATRPVVFSGQIAAGKTTLIAAVTKRIAELGGYSVTVISDISEDATVDSRMLEGLYDGTVSDIEFQAWKSASMFSRLWEAQKNVRDVKNVIIMDRGPVDNEVFSSVRMLLQPTEASTAEVYKAINGISRLTAGFFKPACVVAMWGDEDDVLEAIKKRGRKCEEGIGRGYLSKLQGCFFSKWRGLEAEVPVVYANRFLGLVRASGAGSEAMRF